MNDATPHQTLAPVRLSHMSSSTRSTPPPRLPLLKVSLLSTLYRGSQMCALIASESGTLVAANFIEPGDKNSHRAGRRLHLIWVAAWVAPEDAASTHSQVSQTLGYWSGRRDEVMKQL